MAPSAFHYIVIHHIGRATHFVVSGWQEMSKGGQKLQSGRLTHLVDQQICWYGWCWLAVPFVVSVPFDDKISWYGHAFRINILYNWPILLMDKLQMVDLQNQHSVQFSQMLAGGGSWSPNSTDLYFWCLFVELAVATSKPLIVIVKVTTMVKVTSWSEQVQPQHNRKAKCTLYQWIFWTNTCVHTLEQAKKANL